MPREQPSLPCEHFEQPVNDFTSQSEQGAAGSPSFMRLLRTFPSPQGLHTQEQEAASRAKTDVSPVQGAMYLVEQLRLVQSTGCPRDTEHAWYFLRNASTLPLLLLRHRSGQFYSCSLTVSPL